MKRQPIRTDERRGAAEQRPVATDGRAGDEAHFLDTLQVHQLELEARNEELARAQDALRVSRDFVRSVIDSLSAHICVLAADGVILAVNRAWRRFAEANPPQVGNVNEGANYLAVCDAATGPDREIARAFAVGIRAVMAGTIPFFELEYPCHSPEVQRWFVGRVTRLGAGSPGRVAIAHENITQRRRAEERFRVLFESSRDAIMTLEPPAWRFTSGNPATVRLFRAKDEAEFTSKEPWTLSPECQPDGRLSSDKAREMIETAMRAGSHFFEWTHRRIDGEDFPATVLLTRMEEHRKRFLQATVRDSTRQKRDEEQLRQMLEESDKSRQVLLGMAEDQQKAVDELRRKTALLEAQVNATLDGILIVDAHGKKILQNRRMVELWKIPPNIADNPDDRMQLEHVTRVTRYPEQFAEKVTHLYQHPNETSRDEVELKDGTILDRYSAPVLGADGQSHGRIWMFRDVTIRRQMEEQMVQADKMVALGQLVAGVAHEINNPTSMIMLNSEVLAESWQDVVGVLDRYRKEQGDFEVGGISYSEMRQEIPAMLKGIREGSERIKRIVGDLKRFARAEPPDLTELVNVSEVVQKAVSLLSKDIQKGCRNFRLHLSHEIRPSHGSFQRLEQVVVNLIQNACHSLPDPERAIDVHTLFDHAANANIIQIIDEGTGIPENLIQRIREPFFTTRRDKGGTGLGLSVSDGIVRDHGGSLAFESILGKGTKVTVTLPVRE